MDQKVREQALQVAGAVWALAAPERETDSTALIDLVDRVLGEFPTSVNGSVMEGAERMSSKFQEYSNAYESLMAEVKEKGKKAYEDDVRAFMEAHPDVQGFHFRQSTPAFNDGDPCYNSLDGPYLRLSSLDEDEDEDGVDRYSCPNNEYVEWLVSMANEDLLETIYGTNHQVTATRTSEGIVFKEGYYDSY